MKIKLIRGLLVLLCLLPATIGAQTLNRYEYWFDDNYAGRKAGTLSGTDKVISKAIPTEGLDYGVHRFNIRVRRSDNMYSAVTSQLFLKLDRGTSNTVEYWFDDNIDNCSTIPLPAFDEDCDLTLDLADAVNFPLGFHKLNMRVTTEGNGLSAVSTSDVLKLAGGVATQLEFWFDDDIAHSQRLNGKLASTGDAYIYNTNLDLAALPVGLHRLNYRAVCPDSDLKSAVMSQTVMKLPSGTIKYMEYWVDGNIGSRKRVTPNSTSSNTDIVFNRTADLGATNAGAHRLYMRGVSADRKMSTAITSMPVIVKSQYSNINPADVMMKSYSILVDGQVVESRDFSYPKTELVMSHLLDSRNLSTGTHTLKARLWNSASAGISLEQSFKVNAMENPTLTLSATESNGLVKLQFNPVPNDIRYRIIRKNASGATAKVNSREGSSYPNAVQYTDNPAAGTYTYYVETLYSDYSGVQHRLVSNEVEVQVTNPQTETIAAQEFGYIIGRILCDRNTPMQGVSISFSDGETANVTLTGFARTQIPVGEPLTLTVEGDDTHDYESKTITVNAGCNYVELNGVLKDEYIPNSQANDLSINSAIELIEENGRHSAKFSVKNLSHDHDWKGVIRIKIIDKKKADKMDEDIASMSYETKNLNIGESGQITIGYNASKEVTVFLKGVTPKKDTDYYLYFESVGKWTNSELSENTKPIAPNESYDVADNPVVKTIGPTAQNAQEWDNESRENFACFMLALSSLVPGIDGMVGDLSPFYDKALAAAKSFTNESNAGKAIKKVFEWLSGKTVTEAWYEPTFLNLTSAAYDIYSTVRNTVKPSLVQKYWKDILEASWDYDSATLMIGELADIATAVTTDDPLEASLACANMLYSLVYDGTAVPYATMMYVYQVVGKSMIAKAMEFAAIMHDTYLSERLRYNKPFSGEKTGDNANRVNSAIDFKIAVKTGKKDKTRIDFTKPSAQEQIKDVVVWAQTNPAYPVTVFHFNTIFQKDGFMLESNGKVENISGISFEGKPLDKFCLVINWANGRQTIIPLN